jgi:hypothetical protein
MHLHSHYVAAGGDDTYVLSLLCIFIRGHYPTANDFGLEVIPMAAKDYDVQVFTLYIRQKSKMNLCYLLLVVMNTWSEGSVLLLAPGLFV